MSRTAAVLPIKSLDRAKSRLGTHSRRGDLAAAMAADVLDALGRTAGVHSILVVARSRPDRPGVSWVPDEREEGHVAAAVLGVRAAVAQGAERVLLVPSDCPGLDPAELEELLRPDPAATRRVVLVPDRHGTGTNALLLEPPGVIRPSFGAGSFARHAALARAAGAVLDVAEPSSLLHDVDTPEDLEALQAALAPGTAARTRALLPLRA